jgi:hypothetical protein
MKMAANGKQINASECQEKYERSVGGPYAIVTFKKKLTETKEWVANKSG